MPQFILNGQLTNTAGWGMIIAGVAGLIAGPFLDSIGVVISNPEQLIGTGFAAVGLRRAVKKASQ